MFRFDMNFFSNVFSSNKDKEKGELVPKPKMKSKEGKQKYVDMYERDTVELMDLMEARRRKRMEEEWTQRDTGDLMDIMETALTR